MGPRAQRGDREYVIRELILVRKGLEPELAATTARAADCPEPCRMHDERLAEPSTRRGLHMTS
jgi:hypothetical protein